eukprot:scaffold213_cov150-Skeletonema_menzelii.AAC.3
MKAPLVIVRAALIVPRHRAGSTLPSQYFRNASTAQRRRQRTTHYPAQNVQRYCTTVLNNANTDNHAGTTRTPTGTGTNDLNPFKWSDITDLFTDPHDPKGITNNYIPSDHPNLALFRRSTTTQDLYEEHKKYLTNNWNSPYDYLVHSKFGEEFGFEKELVRVVDDSGQDSSIWNNESNGLPQSPEGFRYQCNPSLSQASDYTIQNGLTYLKLVLNDFPYDVEAGIHHWCLWKIGGKCRTEGIIQEELQWALQELNSYQSDGVGCSSSLIVKQNEWTESVASSMDKLSTFYWVNPPHLQSSKFIACVFIAGYFLLNDDQLQYQDLF